MKEATGEANMTVITIILIAVIAAVAIPIVKNAMTNTSKKACCSNAGNAFSNGKCYEIKSDGSYGSEVTDYWDSANNTCK